MISLSSYSLIENSAGGPPGSLHPAAKVKKSFIKWKFWEVTDLVVAPTNLMKLNLSDDITLGMRMSEAVLQFV